MSDFITRKAIAAQIRLAEAKNDETGASAAEYGLLVAGVAVVITAAVFALGGRIDALFDGLTFTAP